MLARATIVLCVVSLVLACAAVASATTYTFTQLGTLGTYTTSIPYAFNTVGGQIEAVGRSGGNFLVTNGGYPVVWSNAGAGGTAAGTNLLSEIPGATAGDRSTGIDSNGDVVGYSRNASGSRLPWYLPAGSGTATVLPSLTTTVGPYAINNSQQIVGEDGALGLAIDGTAVNSQAVIWTQSSGNWGETALPNLSGGTYSGAYAITNSGTIGGWSNVNIGGTQYQDAVTWTYNGSSWVANDLVNRSLSQNALGQAVVTAVANSTGEAVGCSALESFPGFSFYAAIFSGGTATDLTLPYSGSSGRSDSAYGVNDSGVVVGTSLTGNSTTSSYDAFVYNLGGNGLVQDMNTVYASIIPSGWSLTAATAIDDNGDISGYASYSGHLYGFMITAAVPEPSTLLLLATGLVGLLAYAWRKRR